MVLADAYLLLFHSPHKLFFLHCHLKCLCKSNTLYSFHLQQSGRPPVCLFRAASDLRGLLEAATVSDSWFNEEAQLLTNFLKQRMCQSFNLQQHCRQCHQWLITAYTKANICWLTLKVAYKSKQIHTKIATCMVVQKGNHPFQKHIMNNCFNCLPPTPF